MLNDLAKDIVCNHFHELRYERPFAIQIIRELIDRGLIINETRESVLEDEVSLIPPSTTPIGKKFLNVISSMKSDI